MIQKYLNLFSRKLCFLSNAIVANDDINVYYIYYLLIL